MLITIVDNATVDNTVTSKTCTPSLQQAQMYQMSPDIESKLVMKQHTLMKLNFENNSACNGDKHDTGGTFKTRL